MAHCTGCSGTCCTGIGNDPCTCDETRTSHDGYRAKEVAFLARGFSPMAADDPPPEVHPDAPLPTMGTCWICGDHATDGQEGFSSAPMVLPGFTKPVWICGNCIIRASHEVDARQKRRGQTVAESIVAGVAASWSERNRDRVQSAFESTAWSGADQLGKDFDDA